MTLFLISGLSTPIIALIILIVAVFIRTSMVESPFVLKKIDTRPKFMNASAQEIQKRAHSLGEDFLINNIYTIKAVKGLGTP